jgi:hypothetical protein
VQERVLERAATLGKPVVVCFLGGDPAASAGNVHRTGSLQETARKAAALARSGTTPKVVPDVDVLAGRICAQLLPSQRFFRGLYSGGTFCLEAQLILRDAAIQTWSNAPLAESNKLADVERSSHHTAIDLGSDEFTVGRPHPMIDYATRIDRLMGEAADPAVACIVLDVVLGYGSHPSPAEVLSPAIRQAKSIATAAGRELPVICFVCGTDGDPQPLESQKAILQNSGAVLVAGSTAAAELAAAIATQMARNGSNLGSRAQQGGERR